MAPQSTDFVPLELSFSEIRRAIPDHLFVRSTWRSSKYLIRDIVLAVVLWRVAAHVDPLFDHLSSAHNAHNVFVLFTRASFWIAYWWFQGLVFTGLWVIGHECGHGAFSSSKIICNTLGFIIHTLLWTPYFSWKFVHQRHHAYHASVEHDEVYVPKTRSDLGIPREVNGQRLDYSEYFGDTPIWTLFLLIRQQMFAFPYYLLTNVSGQKRYPKWTNHFNPNAIFFHPSKRNAVWASNFGILAMATITAKVIGVYGIWKVIKLYGIPWLCVSHWFVMITYLHHTDIDLPHYREREWNFQRGAAATVDRDFLGWQGRFFLHDVAHFHTAHHFFPKMPWYNGEEATEYLKTVLGPHYHKSERFVFLSLWKTYNLCQFVEDEGDILFYKDNEGKTNRSNGCGREFADCFDGMTKAPTE